MLADTDFARCMKTATFRGKFYIMLRSGNVQRWAASAMPIGRDYSTLNSMMWKRAGFTGNPANSTVATAGSTYYFAEESQAVAAGTEFLVHLQNKGVKI